MHLKTVVLDGFKSYGKRTEITGFDSEFTAITGLNGTGKSNILDAICFVMGISNLGQVRATSLQELVYKSGQAGITKATVTLVFANTNEEQCPLGYEKCREISVTRQVVVGGKNKYLINGKIVLNKKVIDLFCSVKLNINNPNFLIMQGRITKVLNMKPHEILSMIEEAAGTSSYETKRQETNNILVKKDAKLKEINALLVEEIEPKLAKLRVERAQYLEFQQIVRDIEYLTRISISYKYLQYKKSLEKCTQSIDSTTDLIETNKQKILDNNREASDIEIACQQLQDKLDTESGGLLNELEKELSIKSKAEGIANSSKKAAETNLQTEKRKLKTLEKSTKDDENVLLGKENQLNKVSGLFQGLKDTDEADAKAYADAIKKFEAISSGLATNEDGEAATLQDQLSVAKTTVSTSQTTIKQSDMEMKHTTKLLMEKKNALKGADSDYLANKKKLSQIENEINKLEHQLTTLNYEEGSYEELERRRSVLVNDIRDLKMQLNNTNSHYYDFQYSDPEPNFNRNRVRGMVCKLFDVRDEQNSLALSMCAGGNLYSIVTDTDVTSKKLLQNGHLRKRVTIIPMNKITGSSISNDVIRRAQDLVGKENVATALSLISYDRELDTVFRFIFGRAFICKDINVAKKVTYHPQILCRSVTLEGDVIDPEGTLSGGSRPKGGSVLKEVAHIKQLETDIVNKEHEIRDVNRQMSSLHNISKQYNQIKERLGILEYERDSLKKQLSQTSFEQQQKEIEELNVKLDQLKETIKVAKEFQEIATKKIKDIETKLADAKGYRERELKAASDEMKRSKSRSESSKSNWTKHEQEFETLKMEIEELKKSIATGKEQIIKMTENISELEEKLNDLQTNTKEAQDHVTDLKTRIKEQKDRINSQNRELKMKYGHREKLHKQNAELELEIKKKESEITKLRNENKDGFDKIKNLETKYKWIPEDKQYFGVKNTRYDYSKEDPKAATEKLTLAQQQKTTMERNINVKAMILLEREEEQFKEVTKRRKIVEDDKKKIKDIILGLDEKKKLEVKTAWKAIDRYFGEIFGTLLPSTQATLVPAEEGNFLKGLSVKVGFNGLWKESLNELSGGQRSLVALSLILAMLKYKPSPLYILDEVDAALDMSHTQNIGNMLKAHFNNSQFIIVSLKDGMFNNANVLFRTKFEDGVSGVTRIVNPQRAG